MNSTKADGVFDQAKGKVKQTLGETFNNQKLANEGAADQVKGHVKEAAKDVSRDDAAKTHAHAEDTGHDARNSVTSAAENVKDSINRGLDNLKRDHDKTY